MNLFDPMPPALHAQEYFDLLEAGERKDRIGALFHYAEQLTNLIQAHIGFPVEAPIVKIKLVNSFFAEAIFNQIEISQGFIDFCLAIPPVPFSEVIECQAGDPLMPDYQHCAVFAWTVGHEYFHGIRAHGEVLRQFSGSQEHQQAVEIDSDLFAVGLLYRLTQGHLAWLYPDSIIRQIVFASLFWGIRHFGQLPGLSEGGTHPPLRERLYHIMIKLTHLNEVPFTQVDPGKMPEGFERTAKLLENVAGKTERLFKQRFPEDLFDFQQFSDEFARAGGWTKFTNAWEELRGPVSSISSTKT
ncbi:hypothetical protein PQR62_17160 [Herbaspirillum lusitanum]|uniref:Uncharacterized protein n=1 Tax=Herbaspirillum lusitanum TaxID=213312 RepID=A0ABW9ACP8_9BURK